MIHMTFVSLPFRQIMARSAGLGLLLMYQPKGESPKGPHLLFLLFLATVEFGTLAEFRFRNIRSYIK